MAMDVIGKKPTSKVGRYFGRPAWAWHPLAKCVLALAPVEASGCRRWHTNDSDGLDAAQSVKLADKLDALIESGAVAGYIEKFGEQVEVSRPQWDIGPGLPRLDMLDAAQSVKLADKLDALIESGAVAPPGARLVTTLEDVNDLNVSERANFPNSAGPAAVSELISQGYRRNISNQGQVPAAS